jgi:hypothetical protein
MKELRKKEMTFFLVLVYDMFRMELEYSVDFLRMK